MAVPDLSASRNQIQIDFFGISFGSGEVLSYQYKLEGAAADWSAPAAERSVNYANLAPGTYRFLVRAVDSAGAVSAAPAIVSFKILPPLWRRWWFVTLVLLAAAAAVGAFVRSRLSRLRAVREAAEALQRSREERLAELERVRRRIATDLHDDIGSSLTQISILSEVARQRINGDDAGLAEPLAMIAGASRELVDSMSDIVWAINPQKDHLSDLTQRMRRFASDVLTARNIAFAFREPDEESDVPLGANLRREVFLIFKESVNNLVRHSACTAAEIDFQIAGEVLRLVVCDNGKGFDAALDGDGHGLSSMRQRAEALGGKLDLTSRAGHGTTVTLVLPLARSAA
ncbi:MAG TPA: ATP-binding protein [Blastocatellia bacterium]|nr:ATP-binding protein [Blastocatellia bacterium]